MKGKLKKGARVACQVLVASICDSNFLFVTIISFVDAYCLAPSWVFL
jgi:hypothetical protein